MSETLTDNAISRGVQTYRKIVPFPAAQALLLGGLTYGIGRFAWDPIVETIRSLARIPGRKLGQMTDREWDEAMDELKNDSSYRRWVPAILGAIAAGTSAGFTYTPNAKYYGMFSWNPQRKFDQKTYDKKIGEYAATLPHTWFPKTGSLCKKADDLFEYTGYVPDMDWSQIINARQAQSLFTNDPFLQNEPYARNLGTAIVSNAAIQQHTNTPTLGGVFDSAVDKINKKLTFGGLMNVGVKSVISNATARLFTDVLGKMTTISPETQQNLIDAGTWAGTIAAILQ